jgi:hypothetical protein
MGSRRVVLGLGRAHYGGEFDAAGDDTGRQGILSQGMPPTCPCNVIHATRQVDGQWQPTEWLTVHTDDYDWPLSPCTRFGADGRLHAFWTQLGSAGDLMPHRRSLEYWARTDTGWVDLGDELNPYEAPGLGARVALDFAGPFFAAFTWTVKDTIDGVPQPRRVVHARTHWLTGVDDATPPAVVTLAAWPRVITPCPITSLCPPSSAPQRPSCDSVASIAKNPRSVFLARTAFPIDCAISTHYAHSVGSPTDAHRPAVFLSGGRHCSLAQYSSLASPPLRACGIEMAWCPSRQWVGGHIVFA